MEVTSPACPFRRCSNSPVVASVKQRPSSPAQARSLASGARARASMRPTPPLKLRSCRPLSTSQAQTRSSPLPANRILPSGLKRMPPMLKRRPESRRISFPVFTSHRRSGSSSVLVPEAMRVPSGENARARTWVALRNSPSESGWMRPSSLPLSGSQNRMDLSYPAEASVLPFGANATHETSLLCRKRTDPIRASAPVGNGSP